MFERYSQSAQLVRCLLYVYRSLNFITRFLHPLPFSHPLASLCPQTSLQYASRVKLITNSAERMQESAEVVRLKAQIAALKAGKLIAGGGGGASTTGEDIIDAGDDRESRTPRSGAGAETHVSEAGGDWPWGRPRPSGSAGANAAAVGVSAAEDYDAESAAGEEAGSGSGGATPSG